MKITFSDVRGIVTGVMLVFVMFVSAASDCDLRSCDADIDHFAGTVISEG